MRKELLFVGSVPLADANSVFDTLGRRFGREVRRLPDGETGERLGWVAWQAHVFESHPQFEAIESERDWRTAGGAVPTFAVSGRVQTKQYRPRAGVDATAIAFDALGYAAAARESYAEFSALKRAGAVPAGCRFMVAIPSPYNVLSWGVAPEARTAVEPAYERAMAAEIAAIVAAIPHHELAIQWDCAHDMQAFEGARTPWFAPPREGIIERLARAAEWVPPAVELGYHLCYGTYGGRHFVEPKDSRAMVELANGVFAHSRRSIEWVHMPVPIERDDDAYFAPLAALRPRRETIIHLGLIHDQDGVEGCMRRMRAANRYLGDYGIATECGFGRRDPDSLARLLDVHAALIAA